MLSQYRGKYIRAIRDGRNVPEKLPGMNRSLRAPHLATRVTRFLYHQAHRTEAISSVGLGNASLYKLDRSV